MVMASELASPCLRGAGGCSARALLMALQGVAKKPSMGTGGAGAASETCLLKSCWCCNRDISLGLSPQEGWASTITCGGQPLWRTCGCTSTGLALGHPVCSFYFWGVGAGGEWPACAQQGGNLTPGSWIPNPQHGQRCKKKITEVKATVRKEERSAPPCLRHHKGKKASLSKKKKRKNI